MFSPVSRVSLILSSENKARYLFPQSLPPHTNLKMSTQFNPYNLLTLIFLLTASDTFHSLSNILFCSFNYNDTKPKAQLKSVYSMYKSNKRSWNDTWNRKSFPVCPSKVMNIPQHWNVSFWWYASLMHKILINQFRHTCFSFPSVSI